MRLQGSPFIPMKGANPRMQINVRTLALLIEKKPLGSGELCMHLSFHQGNRSSNEGEKCVKGMRDKTGKRKDGGTWTRQVIAHCAQWLLFAAKLFIGVSSSSGMKT